MPQYVSLHNHTEFSLLDGAGKIDALCAKACKCGMTAIGISDHGNMFGVPKFVLAARKNGLKPIIGSEFYLCEDHTDRTPRRSNDNGAPDEKGVFHQILFAKNDVGYKNLIKLSSISYTAGYYYKPRIDHQLLAQYHEGIVATTCCLASEINQHILHGRVDEAERVFRWYLDLFGQDYYVELQRHGIPEQDQCNAVLLGFAQKYNVEIIATNDVHYVNEPDSEAHDLLLALQTGKDLKDPKRFSFNHRSGPLAGTLNRNFYFKTQDEMAMLFMDLPHALENTQALADKCTFEMNLKSDLFLPTFQIPPEFKDNDDYLRHLAFEGATRRYGEITTDVSDRLEHELRIIAKMGFAGYFLIVQEFTNEARRRGVLVGPGRGSAVGSAVAYCVGITDVEPMQYSLLFERFLNPERVSPPDIDIDFDDEGRAEVIQFVVDKYGRQSVAQIITYGTMGARTAIRDVGRVMGISLQEVNRIAKLIPDRPGFDFKKALNPSENPDTAAELQTTFESADPDISRLMAFAQTLEGSARHTGIHAAGVIIAPGDVSDYVPVAVNNTKDNIVITQYDGPSAEMCGLLKMDFLGLKNLSIIKTCLRLIEQRHGVKIDIDNVPLDDPKTYALYQAGETVATFQFESDGMRKYLKALGPTNIEDLIAMNALYRPGPMDNILLFIDRKKGRVPIEYPHPKLEPILSNTYGIMVYQEQIMQGVQVLAGYSLGEADLLRRAMGKKKKEVMEKERATFVSRAVERGLEEKNAIDVFETMAKFAEYGFNKSHAAAYSILAYRTGYLKANYPAEYMAAVLSHHLNEIDKISSLIEECRRMGLSVLPPCVNKSHMRFSVDDTGAIRFGLAAIKGVGEGAAQAIIDDRAENGPYTSLFDLAVRISSKQINKKTLEALAYAGAFDALGAKHRAQFLAEVPGSGGETVLDRALLYGNRVRAAREANQSSLFGGGGATEQFAEPDLPPTDTWPLIRQLNYERDVIGFYLSGHPLDRFALEIQRYANARIEELDNFRNKEVRLAGIVTATRERMTKSGTPYGIITIEDYSGALEISLFKEDYAKFRNLLVVNNCVLVSGQYKPGFRDANAFELRVNNVQFLDGMLEDKAREVVVQLALSLIEPPFIARLSDLLGQYRGRMPLRFEVADPDANQRIVLKTGLSVAPSPDLFAELKRLELSYNVN